MSRRQQERPPEPKPGKMPEDSTFMPKRKEVTCQAGHIIFGSISNGCPICLVLARQLTEVATPGGLPLPAVVTGASLQGLRSASPQKQTGKSAQIRTLMQKDAVTRPQLPQISANQARASAQAGRAASTGNKARRGPNGQFISSGVRKKKKR